MLKKTEAVKKRWPQYFEKFMNFIINVENLGKAIGGKSERGC